VTHSLFYWTTFVAAAMALAPLMWFGFSGEQRQVWASGAVAIPLQLALPALLCLPYAVASVPLGWFRWEWFLLYALLPVAIASLLLIVSRLDPGQRGHWVEFLVLLGLGLAVDLRWFEGAWPHRLAAFDKILLLDAGLYGFLSIRRLTGVGFDLRLRLDDWKIGLREWLFYTPIVIVLGLALGFLHWHRHLERAWIAPLAWIGTFFLIAVPEEIFFRGWMQNLLERRMGRTLALVVTSILFGLAHFNKRTTSFNWRYVLLAAIAGVFYGRAWRVQRRVGASAITHATVDTLWGLLLR
jgi:membrane protease YdiL (CAAX protease family)